MNYQLLPGVSHIDTQFRLPVCISQGRVLSVSSATAQKAADVDVLHSVDIVTNVGILALTTPKAAPPSIVGAEIRDFIYRNGKYILKLYDGVEMVASDYHVSVYHLLRITDMRFDSEVGKIALFGTLATVQNDARAAIEVYGYCDLQTFSELSTLDQSFSQDIGYPAYYDGEQLLFHTLKFDGLRSDKE